MVIIKQVLLCISLRTILYFFVINTTVTLVYNNILIIFITLLVMEHHWKKPLGHVGTWTRVAGLSQQTCYVLDHLTSPKRCIKHRDKQHCLFHSSECYFSHHDWRYFCYVSLSAIIIFFYNTITTHRQSHYTVHGAHHIAGQHKLFCFCNLTLYPL